MSENRDQEWFSDGVSEELLNLLTRVPELRVIARTSSFQFKGQNLDVRAIADTLGVANILEGSVRRSGDALRITVRLSDGSDGAEIWSDQYDRTAEDIFRVQDEIAAAVVGELRVALLGDALDRQTPASTEVHDLFLQGRYFADRPDEADLNRAIELLTRAIDLDPNFAPAFGQRAAIYANMALYGMLPSDSASALQIADVERARALDPDDPLDLSRRAATLAIAQWNWEEARAAMARALELAPADPRVAGNASAVAAAYGDLDEALRTGAINPRADPLNAIAHGNLAFVHYMRGEFADAERAWNTALQLTPNSPFYMYRLSNARLLNGDAEGALEAIRSIEDEQWGLAALPLIRHALGNSEQSDAALAELVERYADINPVAVAEAHAYRGEIDEAFEWLDRSYEERVSRVAYMKGNPLLTNLFDDPRYNALLERIGLPPHP
ncbi:MAG: tetratricopeptide repeat protein [Gemmatimonadetes bacterium]|nr:tetratricopeptide repeat protein [Gemmatimonadota bacterium]